MPAVQSLGGRPRWLIGALIGWVAVGFNLAQPSLGAARSGARPADANEEEDDGELGLAGPPIVAAPLSASTHLQYCEAVFERLKLGVIDVYEATSEDPPALRQRVVAWLTGACRADADLGAAPTWEAIYEEGDAILEAGCKHPLVVSYAAQCDLVRGRLKRCRERHAAVSAPLLDNEYGTLARFFEAYRLMRLDYFRGRDGSRRASEKLTTEALMALAVEESNPLRQRMLLADFTSLYAQLWGRDDKQKLLTNAIADGRINPWLRAMLAGKEARDRAWRARGGGYASEVEEERWKPFYEGIAEAKTHYKLAYDLQPDLPEAAGALIRIALADPEGDVEDLHHWFAEARAAQIDYRPAYTNLLWGMRPRWHGSHGEMYALAQQWYAEGRFDTDAPYMAAQAVFDIGSEMGGFAKALKPEEPFTLVMSVLQEMADHPQHAASVRRSYSRGKLLTHQISAAIQGGREAEARQALDTILAEDLTVDDSIIRSYDLQPELHVPRLFARTGGAVEAVEKLALLTWDDKHADRAALVRTIESYEEAKRLTDDPRADAYFDHWTRIYSMERDFVDGEWVEPPFEEGFQGWHHPIHGLWTVEGPSSAVSRQSDESTAPYMWSACYLAEPYEVEVEVEPIYETSRLAWSGIYAGDNDKGYYFWINRTDAIAGATTEAACEKPHPIPQKDKYLMSVRIWPGYGELWLDGKKLFGQELEGFEPSGYFALCLVPKRGHTAEVRYSNLRFRKIAPRPAQVATEDAADDAAAADKAEDEGKEPEGVGG